MNALHAADVERAIANAHAVLDGRVAPAADLADRVAIEIARILHRVVVFGEAGDEFDAAYVDLGGEGGG